MLNLTTRSFNAFETTIFQLYCAQIVLSHTPWEFYIFTKILFHFVLVQSTKLMQSYSFAETKNHFQRQLSDTITVRNGRKWS